MENQQMGFINPLMAVILTFSFLGVLLYKRVNLAITLNATALLLALLTLDWQNIPKVIFDTTNYSTVEGMQAILVVLATFGITFLSQLYNETGVIKRLSESLSKIVKNSKIISSVLPAVIGFLPVAGGALMSAPIVDAETEKLRLTPEKKTYVNLWFRHTIFPVYPISQLLITTAALTNVPMFLIILRQIPVVIVMVIVGYFIAFWKVSNVKSPENHGEKRLISNLKNFFVFFSPILATIAIVVALGSIGFNSSKQGFDVLIATLVGILILIIISKANSKVLVKPLKNRGIYGITLAVYGAFLLRNVIKAAGVSEVFSTLVTNGNVNIVALLTIIPGVLGFLTGSPLAGVSISVSIMEGVIQFLPNVASLIYMSAYLGYIIAPTHLCFTFTAEYFKCSLGKAYKYVVPSFLTTFTAALLIYFLV
jgi:integral membrane protein (TIGR00529 family)